MLLQAANFPVLVLQLPAGTSELLFQLPLRCSQGRDADCQTGRCSLRVLRILRPHFLCLVADVLQGPFRAQGRHLS